MYTEDKDKLLSKIRQLTTPFGIYQFGIKNKPNPAYGYALDDQVRALIIANEFNDANLINIYTNYIIKSKRPDGLLFQFCDTRGNFVDNSSKEETQISQDAYGETIWAILKTKAQTPQLKEIFGNLIKYADYWKSLRPQSYAILGLTSTKNQIPIEKKIIDNLIGAFLKNTTPDWQWFEETLIYANAVIPWALFEEAITRNNSEAKKIAQKSLDFLLKVSQTDGFPTPIGFNGWFKKGGQKALYGQQPICAGYMVCCLEKAYIATNEQKYLDWAKKWWGWFWGNNTKKISLVDENFACFDGINENGLYPNQGAESTICFLLAYLSAKRMGL